MGLYFRSKVIVMTKEQKEQIRTILLALEQDLSSEIEQLTLNSKPVALDQQAVGRVSRVDAIAQQQMNLSSLRRLKARLDMVKDAKNRVDLNDFGHCAVCEEPIAFERLQVRPESRSCISCASKD